MNLVRLGQWQSVLRCSILVYLIWSIGGFHSVVSAQDDCFYYADFWEMGDYMVDYGVLDKETHMHIRETDMLLNGEQYEILGTVEYTFDQRSFLDQHYSCALDFSSFTENISGTIREITFTEEIPNLGHQIDFIKLRFCGANYKLILTTSGLYQMRNINLHNTIKRDYLISKQIDYPLQEISLGIDSMSQLTILQAAVYDTVTEQVLEKEAYNLLEVNENQFINDTLLITQETSECDAAILDTMQLPVLIKESSIQLTVQPAQFETVTEQVLQYDRAGILYHARETLDVDTILTKKDVELQINTIDNMCDSLWFLPCIDYEIITTPVPIDTLGVYDVYPACTNDYMPIGIYCVDTSNQDVSLYRTRTYEKLAVPAQILSVLEPDEFVTMSIFTVTNKEMLSESCIVTTVDTLIQEILSEPASLQETAVSAQYGTIYRYNEILPLEIDFNYVAEEETLSIQQESNIDYVIENKSFNFPKMFYCQKMEIVKQLFLLNYLNSDDVDSLPTEDFYRAIFQYQLDHNLAIGVIDSTFLNHLLD